MLGNGTRLPASSFVRVEADVTFTIAGTDVELGGKVAIEQTKSATGVKRPTLGFTGLKVKFGTSEILTGGEGVLLVLPEGIAGHARRHAGPERA